MANATREELDGVRRELQGGIDTVREEAANKVRAVHARTDEISKEVALMAADLKVVNADIVRVDKRADGIDHAVAEVKASVDRLTGPLELLAQETGSIRLRFEKEDAAKATAADEAAKAAKEEEKTAKEWRNRWRSFVSPQTLTFFATAVIPLWLAIGAFFVSWYQTGEPDLNKLDDIEEAAGRLAPEPAAVEPAPLAPEPTP